MPRMATMFSVLLQKTSKTSAGPSRMRDIYYCAIFLKLCGIILNRTQNGSRQRKLKLGINGGFPKLATRFCMMKKMTFTFKMSIRFLPAPVIFLFLTLAFLSGCKEKEKRATA